MCTCTPRTFAFLEALTLFIWSCNVSLSRCLTGSKLESNKRTSIRRNNVKVKQFIPKRHFVERAEVVGDTWSWLLGAKTFSSNFCRNLFWISPEICSWFLQKSFLDFSRNLILVSANICLCSDERVLSAVHSLASYNTAFWPLFCIEHLHHIYEAGRGLRSWQWGVLSTYVEQCLTVNWFKIILSQQSACCNI